MLLVFTLELTFFFSQKILLLAHIVGVTTYKLTNFLECCESMVMIVYEITISLFLFLQFHCISCFSKMTLLKNRLVQANRVGIPYYEVKCSPKMLASFSDCVFFFSISGRTKKTVKFVIVKIEKINAFLTSANQLTNCCTSLMVQLVQSDWIKDIKDN